MKSIREKRLIVFFIAAAAAGHAGIYYDDAAQCIRVVDFPQYRPCTLQQLLYMDRLYGWDKVSYDQPSDTYAIAADLFVGNNDGTETYLQIGSRAHPRETLVMRGRLVVCAYWIAGQNRESSHWKAKHCTNRLTLGVAGDSSVRPALKFDDPKRAGYTLVLGSYAGTDGKLARGYGGQLYVHYATITSATNQPFGPKRGSASMFLIGDRVVLDHATISNTASAATYGMDANAQVRDTVFERCGAAIINGKHDLQRCTFRRCGIAIRDYGSLDAVLTDCTFEDNDHNWTLAYTNKGLVCIDCKWGPPRRGDLYQCWRSRRTKKLQYPSFVSKRHVVVEVVDHRGKPVSKAKVRVRSEQETWAASENIVQTTNAVGRTHGQGEKEAILLVEIVKQATDVKNRPKVTECSYTIEASAKGFKPASLEGFRPKKGWQTVRIVLSRK